HWVWDIYHWRTLGVRYISLAGTGFRVYITCRHWVSNIYHWQALGVRCISLDGTGCRIYITG
ncbi:hypothetical protein NDU88_000575, partial [Pleurodeles waltl]